MIQKIASFDRKISTPIIEFDHKIISFILYPFAAFFHPKLIWVAYALVYIVTGYDIPSTLLYLVGTGLCLLTTFILKKFTKR